MMYSHSFLADKKVWTPGVEIFALRREVDF